MEDDCSMCKQSVQRGDEFYLQCSSCEKKLHYTCGLGYPDPVKAFRISLGKDQYVCPICLVAREYDFIHMVISRHRELSTPKPAGWAEEVDDNGEQAPAADIVVAEVPNPAAEADAGKLVVDVGDRGVGTTNPTVTDHA